MVNPMQFSIFENILTAIFIIGIIIWICYLCMVRYRDRKSFRTKAIEKAIVFSKDTNLDTSQSVYIQNTNVITGLVEREAVNQVIFRDIENPKVSVVLEVDNDIFTTLKEGEQGKLIFRGNKLISFGALQSQNKKLYKFEGLSNDK